MVRELILHGFKSFKFAEICITAQNWSILVNIPSVLEKDCVLCSCEVNYSRNINQIDWIPSVVQISYILTDLLSFFYWITGRRVFKSLTITMDCLFLFSVLSAFISCILKVFCKVHNYGLLCFLGDLIPLSLCDVSLYPQQDAFF